MTRVRPYFFRRKFLQPGRSSGQNLLCWGCDFLFLNTLMDQVKAVTLGKYELIQSPKLREMRSTRNQALGHDLQAIGRGFSASSHSCLHSLSTGSKLSNPSWLMKLFSLVHRYYLFFPFPSTSTEVEDIWNWSVSSQTIPFAANVFLLHHYSLQYL